MQVITVVLTDKEYSKLHRKAYLLGSGQVMGALRLEANLPELPYGYKKWSATPPLPEALYVCPECGTENSTDDVCSSCGHDLLIYEWIDVTIAGDTTRRYISGCKTG